MRDMIILIIVGMIALFGCIITSYMVGANILTGTDASTALFKTTHQVMGGLVILAIFVAALMSLARGGGHIED